MKHMIQTMQRHNYDYYKEKNISYTRHILLDARLREYTTEVRMANI